MGVLADAIHVTAAAEIQELLKRARLRLLRMHFDAKVGHLGGNLSCLDALMVLHHRALTEPDQFVLSKGHAAGALYITLWSKGILTDKDLQTFHQEGTLLAGHPIPGWSPNIPFATGSLGHGLGIAAGLALGNRLQNKPGHVYCLTSDGEWQEGSNWEALIFLAHHNLNNLTVLIDENGLQGFGTTEEVASLDFLADKLSRFAVDVEVIDGHDLRRIESALKALTPRPRIIVLRTIKGKGVSFMENQVAWHYLPMSAEQYSMAMQQVDRQ
jgi:Transketolase, N-terminal subunit